MINCGTIDWLRSFTIFNFAIFDFAATYIGMYLFTKYYRKKNNYNEMFGWGILLGIIVHKILGTNTMLNYRLGLSELPIRKSC